MPRHRQECAHHRRAKAGLRHIQHIFQRRKAERGEHAVHDRVKPVVKRRMMPQNGPDGQALAKLLRAGDDEKVADDQISKSPCGKPAVQQPQQHALQHIRRQRGQRAAADERPQNARRLLFNCVQPIHAHQQRRRRQQGRQKQERTHGRTSFSRFRHHTTAAHAFPQEIAALSGKASLWLREVAVPYTGTAFFVRLDVNRSF